MPPATATEPKPVKTGAPEPIKVRPGDMVYWYKFGDTTNPPLPAMVIYQRGHNALCIQIFSQNGHEVKDGVKHRDDPTIVKMHRERVGCWGLREA